MFVVLLYCRAPLEELADTDAWKPQSLSPGSFPDATRGFRQQLEPDLQAELRPELVDREADDEENPNAMSVGLLYR